MGYHGLKDRHSNKDPLNKKLRKVRLTTPYYIGFKSLILPSQCRQL